MNKIKFLTIFIFMALLTVTSCSEDNEILPSDNQENIIKSFSINNNLNQRNSDELYIIENIVSTDSDINLQLEGLVMTIDANNKKGYFTKDNEVGSIAFDLVINDEVFQIYEIQLIDNESNGRLSRIPGWLCGTKCVLEGFAMSLLDGPAPIMDIAAALYTYQCAADC